MRATCFVIGAAALCGCLDFDAFRTEPTTSSSSAGGAGGAGSSSSSMSNTTSSMSTSSGMGGMGGDGGGGGTPALPPCGTYTDDFDGMTVDLDWDFQGPATFAGDRAVTGPPNGSFWYWDDTTLTLDECAIGIDVVTDTDETWFFGWTSFPGEVLRVSRNDQKELHVSVTGGTPADVIIGTNVLTTRVRISETGGTYTVETAPLGTTNWTVQHSLTIDAGTMWLDDPGYPWFGALGAGSGTDAEFDNYSLP